MSSPTSLKFGWKAGTEQHPPRELLEYAVTAEQAGFDSIDVSDHFHPWSENGQACFVWTWLGAAAAKTTKIILGTGVTLNEYSATGLWPPYNTRQAQMSEAIELIRALWTGEAITHRGKYYQTRKAKLYTRSDESVPLYISAMVPNSARFAGLYGDGLVTVGGETPETYHQILENFSVGAKAAGKDPNRLPRLIDLGFNHLIFHAAGLDQRAFLEGYGQHVLPRLR